MRDYSKLIMQLRSGDVRKRATVLGGVDHDQRCLEAADVIEFLTAQLDRWELPANSTEPNKEDQNDVS